MASQVAYDEDEFDIPPIPQISPIISKREISAPGPACDVDDEDADANTFIDDKFDVASYTNSLASLNKKTHAVSFDLDLV